MSPMLAAGYAIVPDVLRGVDDLTAAVEYAAAELPGGMQWWDAVG